MDVWARKNGPDRFKDSLAASAERLNTRNRGGWLPNSNVTPFALHLILTVNGRCIMSSRNIHMSCLHTRANALSGTSRVLHWCRVDAQDRTNHAHRMLLPAVLTLEMEPLTLQLTIGFPFLWPDDSCLQTRQQHNSIPVSEHRLAPRRL